MSRFDQGEARVLAFAMVGTISAVLPAFVIGAVAVQARAELHFDEAGQGFLVAVPFIAAAATSAWFGRVAQRLGGARTLRLTSLIAAVVMLGVAAAPTFAFLAVGLAAAGSINSLAQPGANLVVARGIDVRNQGLAFGMKQSAMPGATMLAGLAVPTIALTVGWRWAYVAGAAIALSGLLLRPGPIAHDVPLSSRARADRPRPDAPLFPLVVLAAGAAFGAAAAGAQAGFLVSAAVEAGMAEGAAGWLLTIGSLLGIVMRIFQGARVDRGERGPLQVVIAMLVVGAAAFVAYATMVPVAMVLATPVAFGFGWAWPGLFNFSVVRNNPSAPASATGITQTGTYVGAMAGPLAFGAIAQHASYEWAWLVGAGWFLASAAFMVAGRRLLLRVKAARGLAPHETLGPTPGPSL